MVFVSYLNAKKKLRPFLLCFWKKAFKELELI